MALSEIDRSLLERCIAGAPRAWEDFVDRYMGLVIHVINNTAQNRSILLTASDREDLAAEVMMTIVKDDYAVLRHFRRKSSLATYLTVIVRRIVVRQLMENRSATPLSAIATEPVADEPEVEQRMTDREEVERLLQRLDGPEENVMRMYHLEGKSYQEIGQSTGMPTNSIGPMLSRARAKLRSQAHN